VTDLSPKRKALVLLICCMSLLIVGIDSTIVNVALPSIQRSLHTSISGLQWTVDAYILVIGSLLMLSGSTADRIGRRRVFQVGLVLFTAGSGLCSLAPNLGCLIAFRMVQAIGGSMLNPVAMSIITNVFTDAKERARAIGVWAGVVGISLALGPVVGGALVTSIGWRSIFWINIPVGMVALTLTRAFVPESRAIHARRPDPLGQLFVIVALASLIYAIIEGPDDGWGSPTIIGFFALAAFGAFALINYERRRQEPLLDMRFFRSVPFASATLIAVCGFAALGGFIFLNTLYLQDVRGYSALHAGLYMIPLAAMILVCGPISGRVVGSFGARWPLTVSGVCIAISGFILTGLSDTTPTRTLIVTFVLFGTGFGLLNPPITNTAVSGMPRTQAGVAAAIASTSRQVGQSLGVAVVGSALSSVVHGDLQHRFTGASHAGYGVVSGCGVAVLVLGLISTNSWARRTATETARRLDPDATRPDASTSLQSSRR
jgi:EmrB/QacA subfamily drug resistance transporter